MDYDAIVIGAGFGGLYALKRLRDDLGLKTHLFEQGSGIGGTWFWNKYPGAMSDTRSHLYCYSFDKELLQADNFKQHYRMQPEVLSYLENFAKRYDLNKDISISTEVVGAVWDNDARCWQVEVAGGRTVSARFVISALGLLSKPNIPPFPGIETLRARWFTHRGGPKARPGMASASGSSAPARRVCKSSPRSRRTLNI